MENGKKNMQLSYQGQRVKCNFLTDKLVLNVIYSNNVDISWLRVAPTKYNQNDILLLNWRALI